MVSLISYKFIYKGRSDCSYAAVYNAMLMINIIIQYHDISGTDNKIRIFEYNQMQCMLGDTEGLITAGAVNPLGYKHIINHQRKRHYLSQPRSLDY